MPSYIKPEGSYLLCVLRDHKNEREVVHPERSVEQPVRIDQEDDVLHSVFDQVWFGL